MAFSINIIDIGGNVGHINNIGLKIGLYYGVNIVSGTSNRYHIADIYLIAQYLNPCLLPVQWSLPLLYILQTTASFPFHTPLKACMHQGSLTSS